MTIFGGSQVLLDFDLRGLDEKDEEGQSKKSRGKYYVFVF
jgi:hypothetical protein